MIFYIINNINNTLDTIKSNFSENNLVFEEIKNVFTIDELIKNIILTTENKSFKKDSYFIFEKPSANKIAIYDSETDGNIILNQFDNYDDKDLQFYLDNFTSEDGSYESSIFEMKFDFLIEYLNLFEISYDIHDGTVESITNIIKNHI